MTKKSALESILGAYRNPLGKELEQTFQKAIEYVNRGIDYSKIEEGNWVGHRYTMTHQYCKNNLFPEMIKIIGKHTNLRVDKVIDVRCFSGMFAIDISLDNVEDALSILDRQSGTNRGDEELTSGAKDIVELYNKIDVRSGALTTDKFGKDRKISVTMYMDVDMAFLMLDNMYTKMDKFVFTAAELTAIYLHEIGHLVTMLEQSNHVYQHIQRTNNHLASLKAMNRVNSVDPGKVKQSYEKDIRPVLKKLSEAKFVGPKTLELGDSLVTLCEYAEKTSKSNFIVRGINVAISLVLALILNLYITLVLTITRELTAFVIYPLCSAIGFAIGDVPGSKGKTTDTVTSNNVFYHIERLADDYASRHGYSSQLASGLHKLGEVMEIANSAVTLTDSANTRQSTVIYLYAKTWTALTRLLRVDAMSISKDFMGPGAYEADTARVERLLMNLNRQAKQAMTPEVAAALTRDYDSIKKTLEAMKPNVLQRKVSDPLWEYVFDIPAVVRRICQNDDMYEAEKYLTKLDKLMDNELYSQSQMFKYLATRK